MLMPRGEVVAIRIVEDIQGLVEKEDDARQKQVAGTVAKVIKSDDDGHRKVQIAIPKVSKAVGKIVAQEYEIVEQDKGRITDDMECEEIQEGITSIREKLRKANERIVKLEIENKYWRDSYYGVCQPIQQLHQAALPQDSEINLEEILAQVQETKDWINDIIQNGQKFLPAFILTFRLFVSLRDKFRAFEVEWKNFLLIRDLAIPRLQTVIELSEESLVKVKLVNGGKNIVESWYVALTVRSRALEEIQDAIAQYSPSIDTYISNMLSDARVALDFENIKEENFNKTEFGLRLDELGKVAIRKKHLVILASLRALIEFAKDDEKESEKTLRATKSMMNTSELRVRHTPCPPMEEVNNMLVKFIALAKQMKFKGRIVLEDHLM